MEIPLKNSLVLKDFFATIEKVSGLRVCLYGMEALIKRDKKLAVDRTSIIHTRPFCRVVKLSKRALKKCLESDRETPLNALTKPFWRTCHAGLSELVIPVNAKGRYFGSIVAGQVLLKRLSKKTIEKRVQYLSELGVDANDARKALRETPVATDEMLKMALNLLNILVDYIIEVEEKYDWQAELKNIKASYTAQNFENGRESLKYLTRKVKKIKDLRYKNIIDRLLVKVNSMPIREIRLEVVAKEAGFSTFHFSRVFKSSCGINFRKYLASLRVEKAKELMKDVNLDLAEIASQCGYEDLSSFSRAFKTITGSNPGKFRENLLSFDRKSIPKV